MYGHRFMHQRVVGLGVVKDPMQYRFFVYCQQELEVFNPHWPFSMCPHTFVDAICYRMCGFPSKMSGR